jgi:plasmid stabilization system protein ParE
MPRRLSYTKDAIADLIGMRRWFDQAGAGATARSRAQAILTAITELRAAPCRYPRGERSGTRKLTVQGHVVVYVVASDTGDNQTAGDVLVLRVFGPGQRQDV